MIIKDNWVRTTYSQYKKNVGKNPRKYKRELIVLVPTFGIEAVCELLTNGEFTNRKPSDYEYWKKDGVQINVGSMEYELINSITDEEFKLRYGYEIKRKNKNPKKKN